MIPIFFRTKFSVSTLCNTNIILNQRTGGMALMILVQKKTDNSLNPEYIFFFFCLYKYSVVFKERKLKVGEGIAYSSFLVQNRASL